MLKREDLRVVVVDDMSASRELLTASLHRIGIALVEPFTNGPDALNSLLNQPADLVISDLHMPGLDGMGLVRQIRSNPATNRTGYALVTAKLDAGVIETGQRLGVDEFLRKPFSQTQLENCLDRFLAPKRFKR